jgi:hypothetical protein
MVNNGLTEFMMKDKEADDMAIQEIFKGYNLISLNGIAYKLGWRSPP